METGIERIETPGGWWEIRTVVTRGMRKAFRAAGLRGFAKGIDGKSDIDLMDGDALKRAILASPEKWDVDAIDDAYLIYGTVQFSFGDAVTLAAIDALADADVEPVLARMREFYAEMPEGVRRGFFGTR